MVYRGILEKLDSDSTKLAANITGDTEDSIEKPDFVREIESFDLNNLPQENIELVNRTIQNVFREHFPVDDALIDEIPDHMTIVDSEEFMRLRKEANEDAEMDLGFYSLKRQE